MNAVLRCRHKNQCDKKVYSLDKEDNYHQRGVMLIDASQPVTCKMTYLKMKVSFAHLTRLKNHLV